MFLPFFQVWSLEKNLVSKLFSVSERPLTEKHDLPIETAISEVRNRIKIRPRREMPLLKWIKTHLVKCCKRLQRDKTSDRCEQAKVRLERELDIVKVIKSQRLLRKISTLLLSPTEQKLIRLQKSQRTLVSQSELSDDTENELAFLKTLKQDQLSNREKELVTGIYETKPKDITPANMVESESKIRVVSIVDDIEDLSGHINKFT